MTIIDVFMKQPFWAHIISGSNIESANMKFITIDGDDIGQRISACYLSNDVQSLTAINGLVQGKVREIADFLAEKGYKIIFCAADGVAAFSNSEDGDDINVFQSVKEIAGDDITFSAGVGSSLREAYVALLFAKSSGKSRLCNYASMNGNVQGN